MTDSAIAHSLRIVRMLERLNSLWRHQSVYPGGVHAYWSVFLFSCFVSARPRTDLHKDAPWRSSKGR